MIQDMQKRFEDIDNMTTKLRYIEVRAMNDNLNAHEAVRQITTYLAKFYPSGDPGWALRKIKDVTINYLRALGKYPEMSSEEKGCLVRMVLFEAGRQHVWNNEEDCEAKEKYQVTVELCEGIE